MTIPRTGLVGRQINPAIDGQQYGTPSPVTISTSVATDLITVSPRLGAVLMFAALDIQLINVSANENLQLTIEAENAAGGFLDTLGVFNFGLPVASDFRSMSQSKFLRISPPETETVVLRAGSVTGTVEITASLFLQSLGQEL
jgi:hypothetical protein